MVAVVLNWNGWRDTIECLESLLCATRVPNHVIVCDNGSIDGSLARIQRWATGRQIACRLFESREAAAACEPSAAELVLLQNGENRGFAAGNNAGIRYALDRLGADFVWILNNDAIVEGNALAQMLETAAGDDARIAMVGSKLLCYDDPNRIQAIGGGYIVPFVCHDTQLGRGKHEATAGQSPIRLDHLIGASLLVRARAIRDAGYMDESYFLYREETDWCIRMRRRGWKLYCCPQATVWHKQSRSVGFKSPLHDYYAVRNILRLVRKFYPLSLPSAFVYYACRSLLPKLLRFEFARMNAVLRALRDFVRGVEGRPAYHTEAVLLRQYVPAEAPVFSNLRRVVSRPRSASALTALTCAAIAVTLVLKMPHHARAETANLLDMGSRVRASTQTANVPLRRPACRIATHSQAVLATLRELKETNPCVPPAHEGETNEAVASVLTSGSPELR